MDYAVTLTVSGDEMKGIRRILINISSDSMMPAEHDNDDLIFMQFQLDHDLKTKPYFFMKFCVFTIYNHEDQFL